MSQPLKVIFAGTPDFAAQHLAALLSSSHEIIAVFTQPDRPAGRGKKLTASPVKQLAIEHRLPLFQPETLKKNENQLLVSTLNADIMVVVAYGLLLPKAILDMPRLGCINVHGSLLPRWRGAAPIQRACWAGDKETGIAIMQMDEGLDTGDILYKITCTIDASDTSATLYNKLSQLGPEALLHTLSLIEQGNVIPQPQDDTQATYAKKLSKIEAKLDWTLSAKQLERCIRAFNPWPISYFMLEEKPIKVWQASIIDEQSEHPPGTILQVTKQGITISTADGKLIITHLQLAGKKPMAVHEVLNSRQNWFTVGDRLN